MKKIRLDCPTDFLEIKVLNKLLSKYDMIIDNQNPECLIVNPGTDFFLNSNYFKPYAGLKVVGTPSTGVNHVDINYLEQKGIKIFCLLDNKQSLENIHASAEFTWLHIMNAFRKFTLAIKNVDKWREEENEKLLRSNELAGKKIGIIGMGRIGGKIANYAQAFSVKVFYYDPYVSNKNYFKVNSISELKICDIISINCYLTNETRNLITYEIFDGFKENLIVVNTSRGEVVDEEYIYELIKDEKIIYSCDVLQNEQNINKLKESKLFNLKSDRLTITPHVAGATIESQYKALSAILTLCNNYLMSLEEI